MANPPPGKKPGIEIMIGVGKTKGPVGDAMQKDGADKGGPEKKKSPPPKKSSAKPNANDRNNAIAKRLAALSGPPGGGPSPTNNFAGNAMGGAPGM